MQTRLPTEVFRPPITSPPRRRRWVWIALAVLTTMVVLGLLAVGVWISRYDPILAGSFRWASDPPPDRALDLSPFSDAPDRVDCYEATPVTKVLFRYSIRNDGPLSIRITGVGNDPIDDPEMVIVQRPVRMIPDMWSDRRGSRNPAWQPFGPFDLAPGQEAAIEVEATLQRNVSRSSSIGVNGGTIEFSMFGVSRTSRFWPPVQVVFADDLDEFCSTDPVT